MNLRTGLVTLLALGLLAWFLRGTNFADVWLQVQRARPGLLLLSLAAVVLTFFARTIRWRYLLRPLGETRFRTVFRSTVIGFGALAILPIRMGDVIRPYLLARQERMPVTSVFATVVMERVLDLVAVLALMATYVWGFAGEATFPARLLNPIKVSATIAGGVAADEEHESAPLAQDSDALHRVHLLACRIRWRSDLRNSRHVIAPMT